jgi:hypothetical protein
MEASLKPAVRREVGHSEYAMQALPCCCVRHGVFIGVEVKQISFIVKGGDVLQMPG